MYINFFTHMQVNVLGLCMVTREFIKQLRERNVDDGHVVFMNRYCSGSVLNNVTIILQCFNIKIKNLKLNRVCMWGLITVTKSKETRDNILIL